MRLLNFSTLDIFLNICKKKDIHIRIFVQKYRFNRLLTKDPSEVTSLEYKQNKLYSNLPLLYLVQ